jgi:SAM-dependent methyltransferase
LDQDETSAVDDLDQPDRVEQLRALLGRKTALRRLYRETYQRYAECLARCPGQGPVVELGSGAGFVKEVIPEVITSDVVPYAGVDRVIDGTRMPFGDETVRAIFLLNVFHHIADAVAFLREAERCLAPGGRMLIVDQHPGWISSPLLKLGHHEPFRPEAERWEFETSGPLSGANGALAWIVFRRDADQFAARFPSLSLQLYRPHTPLRYWLAGGLKDWSLLPGWAWPLATWIDQTLIALSGRFGSFVDVEILKLPVARPSPLTLGDQ